MGSINSLILNALKRVLSWQQNIEKISKNCIVFSYVEKYKKLRFIKVALLMLKYSKNQCKTYQFETQCKGDIRHAFETAKITVFDPVVYKTSDAPLFSPVISIY